MPQLYDADQNPVEVLSEEAIAELKEKAEKAEQLEATLAEKEEQLEKLSDKEFNFKKFRDSEEARKAEMLESFSAKEQALIKEIDEMRARQDASEDRYFNENKEAILTQLAGDDAELRTKLEDAVKESTGFFGQPKTAQEVTSRYQRAYALLTGTQKTVNPLTAFSPVTGQIQEEGQARFTDTPTGKAILEEKFGKEIAKAKAKNPDLKI